MKGFGTASEWVDTASVTVGIWAAYVVLYRINAQIMGSDAFGGIASIIFLPAFIRLLAFLLLGLWSIVPLFLAALLCVDLGLSVVEHISVSLALACEAPAALFVASNLLKVEPTLSNLNGRNLLILSFTSALASAVAYHAALGFTDNVQASDETLVATIVGDAAGAWVFLYGLKFLLTLGGKWISRRL